MPNPIIDLGYRYACNRFPGDGVETGFEINFAGGYLRPEHVAGFLKDPDNNVEEPLSVSGRTLEVFGPNQVRVTPAVPDGITLVVRRNTPKDLPMLDYNDGAILNDVNLNTSNKQAIFAIAEMVDYFADFLDIFRGVTEDVIDALDYAQQALLLAQQALNRANDAYALAQQALNRANEAWDLANSKPDNFLELDDTPNSYENLAGHVAIVTPQEDGLDLVHVSEIPGLEDFITEVIDEHGGGGGGGDEGIPTTAPVVLHSPDASIPNGLVLTEGANITLKDNGSGGLVIASTGGGGGSVTPGRDVFAVSNATLSGTDVQGAWADPTGTSFVPTDGSTDTQDKNLLFLATDSEFGSRCVKFGYNLKYHRLGGLIGWTGSVSVGSNFLEPISSGANTPDIEKGLYVDQGNVLIGSNLKARQTPSGTGNIEIGNSVVLGSAHVYTAEQSVILKPLSNAFSGPLTGNLIKAYQFGHIDLGGTPGAVGFDQFIGERVLNDHSRKISFIAKPATEDPVEDSFFIIGGVDEALDFLRSTGEVIDGFGATYIRNFLFEIAVVGPSVACKIEAVVRTTRSSSTGVRTITIVHQNKVDIHGTGSSTIGFIVDGQELKLKVSAGSIYQSLHQCSAFVDRYMTCARDL